MAGLLDFLNPQQGGGRVMDSVSSWNDQNPGALVALGAGIMNRNPAQGFANAAPLMQAGRQRNMTIQYLMSKGYAKTPEEAMALAANPVLLTQALKSANGSDVTYGLTPIWGLDKAGNPTLGTLGNNGTFKKIDTPGFQVSKTPIKMDAGTHWVVMDPVTRQPIATIPKDLRGAEAEKAIGEQEGKQAAAAPADVQAAQTALDIVDSLKVDPNRETGTGLSATFGNWIPASPGYDYQNKVDQAKSGAFLTAIQQMRGLGSLSNAEGSAATAAVTRMNTATSEGAFMSALNDYETIVRKGLAKAQSRQQQYGTTVPGISDAATVPPPGNTRLRFNPATGELE